MKKNIIAVAWFSAAALFAAEPVLYYDFSQPVFVQGGKYKQPIIPASAKMTANPQAVQLSGNEILTVPDSADFTLSNGATFYAVVRFDEDGVTNNKADSHDMLLFKYGCFLVGRNLKNLYFNLCGKTNWCCAVLAPNVPRKAWTALAVTVKKNAEDDYTVKLFLNGKQAVAKNYTGPVKDKTSFPITIGGTKKFGKVWNMAGLLGKIMIYDCALSDSEIAEMAGKEPLLK